MSLSTLLFAILGIISFLSFFFLLRYKASSKQTDRTNRIRWSSYFSYKERKGISQTKKEGSDGDAEFRE